MRKLLRKRAMQTRTKMARARLILNAPVVAASAYVRGSAAGLHGGKKLKYGKRDRQANRAEESRVFNF